MILKMAWLSTRSSKKAYRQTKAVDTNTTASEMQQTTVI
jgi:hypothetical protein